MNRQIQTQHLHELTSTQSVVHFTLGNDRRSRSISPIVLTSTLNIPKPTARLNADWEWDISHQLALEPGDVEPLSLIRTQMRWTDYNQCLQAMKAWTFAIGLSDAFNNSDIALMACRGARNHHDAEQYGGAAFCNLFLSEDKDLDLFFPDLLYRIPLTRGTAVVFDTGQSHAVVQRDSFDFDAADFPADKDCSLVFLTWELPIENTAVMQALQIEFTPPSQISPNF
jgi:hypothetical protein